VTDLCKTRAGDKSNVARSNNGDFTHPSSRVLYENMHSNSSSSSRFPLRFEAKPGQFTPESGGDAMFVDVNVGGGDAESSSNFGDGPLFEDIEVKHLKLFWLEAGLQPVQCVETKVLFPFGIPRGFERIEGRRKAPGRPSRQASGFRF